MVEKVIQSKPFSIPLALIPKYVDVLNFIKKNTKIGRRLNAKIYEQKTDGPVRQT